MLVSEHRRNGPRGLWSGDAVTPQRAVLLEWWNGKSHEQAAARMSRHTGAFVYTGSGKKQKDGAPVEQSACKKEACNIQWCLAKRNHQEKQDVGVERRLNFSGAARRDRRRDDRVPV